MSHTSCIAIRRMCPNSSDAMVPVERCVFWWDISKCIIQLDHLMMLLTLSTSPQPCRPMLLQVRSMRNRRACELDMSMQHTTCTGHLRCYDRSRTWCWNVIVLLGRFRAYAGDFGWHSGKIAIKLSGQLIAIISVPVFA